jgi:hypothetical protein
MTKTLKTLKEPKLRRAGRHGRRPDTPNNRRRRPRGRADRARPGVCRVCGCTELRACPGGCCWADPEHTICSRCVAGDPSP